MPQAKKHHYVPKCYLRQWCGADGLLCEYQRPQARVAVRRLHPSATGWLDKLYWISSFRPEHRDALERDLFGRVDQGASDALCVFNRRQLLETADLRSGWSRFLMSMLHRHPGRIEALRDKAAGHYQATIEDFRELYEAEAMANALPFDKYKIERATDMKEALFARVLQLICDSENVGRHLNGMHQALIHVDSGFDRIVTSDNPLVVTNGLAKPDCRLVLPIGPRTLFIAANSEGVLRDMHYEASSGDLIERVNAQVIRQAYRYAYWICVNRRKLMEQYLPRGSNKWSPI